MVILKVSLSFEWCCKGRLPKSQTPLSHPPNHLPALATSPKTQTNLSHYQKLRLITSFQVVWFWGKLQLQIKSNQIKSNQIKSNQIKSLYFCLTLLLALRHTSTVDCTNNTKQYFVNINKTTGNNLTMLK